MRCSTTPRCASSAARTSMCSPRSRVLVTAPSSTSSGCPMRAPGAASRTTSASPEMRGFLAVSVTPQAADRWHRPIDAALAALGDDDTKVDRIEEPADGWLAFAGTDHDDVIGDPGQAFTVRLSRLLRTREADLVTADLPA